MPAPSVRHGHLPLAAAFVLWAIALAALGAFDTRAEAAPAAAKDSSPHRRAAGDGSPGDRAAAERRAIGAATRLLNGGSKYPIVLIDPELAPDSAAIRRVDAFTVKEADGRMRPKVYVNRESPLFQSAARGDDFYVKALAAVLVHESAHLAGAHEAAARLAEQRFLRDLIATGAMTAADGQRYLAQIQRQPVPEEGR